MVPSAGIEPASPAPTFANPNDGVPGEIRTHDLRLRRATLYPAELQAQERMASVGRSEAGGLSINLRERRTRV